MAKGARRRSRVSLEQVGTKIDYGVASTRTRKFTSVIDDVVGFPHLDNALNSEQYLTASGGLISFRLSSGSKVNRLWQGVPSTLSCATISHLTIQIDPLQSRINRTLAGSGPSSPKVNLPVSLFELREIPRMLKHAGDLLLGLAKKPSSKLNPSEAASATLAYQFGWAPIVDDIFKLLDFQKTVEKRRRFLQRLNSGERSIRTRIGLGFNVASERKLQYVDTSTGVACQGYTEKETTLTQWGTVKWSLRNRVPNGMRPVDVTPQDAFRSAFGFTRGNIPTAVWKALPWTWLIDYFSNISDVLMAAQNIATSVPSNMCLMRKYETKITHPSFSQTETKDRHFSLSSFSATKVTKYRDVVPSPTPAITLRIPILDPFKASVLGSLAILRIRRSAS